MIRLSFSTLTLLLMLAPAGCATRRNDTARSEYQHTETTHTREGTAPDADMAPGDQSRQSESIQTHRESTTTTERGR